MKLYVRIIHHVFKFSNMFVHLFVASVHCVCDKYHVVVGFIVMLQVFVVLLAFITFLVFICSS